MSRMGNPYDNAKAESFMKTLKSEEVDGSASTAIIADARSRIGSFIEEIYNGSGCIRRSTTAARRSSSATGTNKTKRRAAPRQLPL